MRYMRCKRFKTRLDKIGNSVETLPEYKFFGLTAPSVLTAPSLPVPAMTGLLVDVIWLDLQRDGPEQIF